jgi:hypothetical protein
MNKFYPLFLLLLFFNKVCGQDCSALSFTYTTSESRCVATGSIIINVTGGTGDYNYKAIGPVITPVTSSNIITGLAPGYYSVLVNDLTSGCTKQTDSIYVAGSYSDPRFQLIKTDASCAGNDGTISVANQKFGRSPFTYTIIAPSPSNVGATNATGSFSGLISGEYVIQLQDSCGGIQVRRITIENYSWWFDSVSVVRNGCDMADVFIRIKDNKGNVNTSGSAFDGFVYGYADNGDTTWFNSYNFSVLLGTKRQLNIVVKDNCGNVHSNLWSLPDNLKPSLDSVGFSNFTCSDFKASVTGQNLSNPSFCLYSDLDVVITCNTNGQFTHLPYGSYCIKVLDACYDTLITRCFTVGHPIPSIASSITISDKNCSTFTATLTGQANLTDPEYCLYDLNDVQIECNLTGVFNNISYGSYCIKVHDACTDTMITRCFSATRPIPVLTGYTISGTYCNAFGVQVMGDNLNNPQYCLLDSLGNEITCNSTGNFDSIPYGPYCVRAISCGDTTNSVCFEGLRPTPSLGTGVQPFDRKCNVFSVSVWGRLNLTDPEYCLFNSNDSLIACNATGAFIDIPYGDYCIKIHNNSACFDTTITRCFTVLHDVPTIDATMQILNSNCTAVSFQVNGTNLTNPTYCLYNASNVLLGCNSSGIFNSYPYGQYCVRVEDGCIDTTMQVCQTFLPPKAITLTTIKSCTINKAYVDVSFSSTSSPYVVKVYHPNGSLVHANATSSNPYRIELNALPTGTKYKVVATDNCGNTDSATITPDVNVVTKNTTVRAKCPGSVWSDGSGDILATATSNWYSVIPQIIKKNGVTFNQSYSSLAAGTYTFADLEPAQYIVQYTQSSCNGKLYDTITVSPYAYPTQGQSAVYQCDNNGFSLSADVHDGVSPYSFQIIGSLPETPSIVTAAQNNPVFSVNNGTTYSLIRLRTIDACGNATLSDVSVLPLQNVSVRVNDSCFYQNITLSIDPIPNTDYSWYKKTSSVDSTLLGSGTAYNLPFFVPEEIGLYVCKVNVNDGCLTRLSSFNLTGNCYVVLPSSFQLNGRKNENANQLSWNNKNEKGVIRYVVERKQANETSFTALGTVPIQSSGNYFFNDNNFSLGTTQYRLKVVYNNKTEYSNIIILKTNLSEIVVYPNPVKNGFSISFDSEKPADYRIELIGTNGQLFYSTETRNNSSSTTNYNRTYNTKPGIYLLRIIDKNTGRAEIRKLVFE